MRFLFHLDDWDGSPPATLVACARSAAQRRGLLRHLAARALRTPVEAVEVAHHDGMPPRLVRPAEAALRVSAASRCGLAAVAVALSPVGIDIEQVEPGLALPLNVLHPREVEHLLSLAAVDRPQSFARLWTCKEAYVKALGLGLSREPASFRVEFLDEEIATIDDAELGSSLVTARTTWRTENGRSFAVSAVILGPEPDRLRPVASERPVPGCCAGAAVRTREGPDE